jgi:hypothetical protein
MVYRRAWPETPDSYDPPTKAIFRQSSEAVCSSANDGPTSGSGRDAVPLSTRSATRVTTGLPDLGRGRLLPGAWRCIGAVDGVSARRDEGTRSGEQVVRNGRRSEYGTHQFSRTRARNRHKTETANQLRQRTKGCRRREQRAQRAGLPEYEGTRADDCIRRGACEDEALKARRRKSSRNSLGRRAPAGACERRSECGVRGSTNRGEAVRPPNR